MKLCYAAIAALMLATTALPAVAEDKDPATMSCDQLAAELSSLASKPASDEVTARRKAIQDAGNTKGCEL